MATCKICGQAVERPFRRYSNGIIVEGCVAKVHDKYLPKPSNTWSWVLSARKAFKKAGYPRASG